MGRTRLLSLYGTVKIPSNEGYGIDGGTREFRV